MKERQWQEYLADVRDLSLSLGEPQWMLELREASLEKLATLELPHIERVKVERMPLFNVGDFKEGQVPESVYAFDEAKDNPLIVQYGKTTTIEQISTKLLEQGVIYTDMQTALQEYPELVQAAYMNQAVLPDEDKLTAFHAAFMNSGVFLYVPKNVVIEEPIEALLFQDSSATTAFVKHVLIVAEENCEFTYLERLKAIGEGKQKISGNVVVEVIAKQGAKIKYAAIDQLSENSTSYVNRRGYIGRDASIDWAIGIFNDGDIVADFDSDLVGIGAHSEIKVVAISSGKQIQGIDTRVTNKAANSIGHILQHGVIRDKATLTFNGIGHIIKGAKNADAQQESRVLMLSEKARGDANPILLIDENEVTAGHAASVGRVDPEEMYYLMSRGLSKHEAERLVIRGFLGSVITAIPIKAVQKELVDVIEGKLV